MAGLVEQSLTGTPWGHALALAFQRVSRRFVVGGLLAGGSVEGRDPADPGSRPSFDSCVLYASLGDTRVALGDSSGFVVREAAGWGRRLGVSRFGA